MYPAHTRHITESVYLCGHTVNLPRRWPVILFYCKSPPSWQIKLVRISIKLSVLSFFFTLSFFLHFYTLRVVKLNKKVITRSWPLTSSSLDLGLFVCFFLDGLKNCKKKNWGEIERLMKKCENWFHSWECKIWKRERKKSWSVRRPNKARFFITQNNRACLFDLAGWWACGLWQWMM